MTLMDLSQIPQYPMKDGFNIRNYSPGDESVWYKIQRSAEPYLEIYDGLFEQEFGQNIAEALDLGDQEVLRQAYYRAAKSHPEHVKRWKDAGAERPGWGDNELRRLTQESRRRAR